jgi:hypothetical protein
MPSEVYCQCSKCSLKDLKFRLVRPYLASRHVKLHGLAPSLSSSTRQVQAIQSPGRSRSKRGLGNENRVNRPRQPPEQLDRSDLDRDYTYDDLGGIDPDIHAGPFGNPPRFVSHALVHAPDNTYSRLQMPEGPDASRDIDPADAATTVPPAFSEPSCVRIAYLQAAFMNIFGHLSIKMTTDNLNMTLNALDAAGSLPDFPRPVRTLESAKRRLGIDPDQWIVQYAICPRCWKHYAPKKVLELATPNCLTPGCTGEIYQERRDSKGRIKRHAVKIIPHTSLLENLRRIVRRKGFRKLVRDSRNTPLHQNADENFVMTDMHDGEIWHDLRTGIERQVGNFGTIRDVPANGHTEHKLTDFRFGLHLSINLDW